MRPETSAALRYGPTWPVRVKSANGKPREDSQFLRTCHRCRASFAGLAAGKSGERGLWSDMRWYCSAECWNAANVQPNVCPQCGYYPSREKPECPDHG